MRRWNLILRVFISEYLHLRPDHLKEPSKPDSAGTVQRSDSELVSRLPALSRCR